MTALSRLSTCAAALLVFASVVSAASAQSFSEPQRDEIRKIIKDYLISNPEVLQEAVSELEKRQAKADADKSKDAIVKHRDELFQSTRQVTLGNPTGDVTLVEFFDYNCGYCKRALNDMMELIKTDPNLRIVLK